MSASKQHFSVFDGRLLQDNTEDGLREVHSFTAEPPPSVVSEQVQRETTVISDVPDKMVCTTCRWPLSNREEQMEHYKLDWHRFNLKQRVSGQAPVTVEEFETKTGAGDMSSISGSDSEESEDSEDSEDSDIDGWRGGSVAVTGAGDDEERLSAQTSSSHLASKVVFQTTGGQYLVVHRCVLQGKPVDGEADLVACLKAISEQAVWVVLMTGGGHFAGAVFKGKEVVQHKTFHRYTVRAKRGTAQGLRDAQNRGHAPKSAGATLRRYNESALLKDIQDLLESWAELLTEASAIFLRAPSYNKTTFFGGRDAPLDKKDPRIRTLPFVTRRATFREVQRVHSLLSTVQTFEKETDLSAVFSPKKKQWKKTLKSAAQSNSSEEKEAADSSDDEELGESVLETVQVELGTLHLREHEVQPSRHRKKKKKKEANKMDDDELNIMGEADQLMEGDKEEEEEEEEGEEVLLTPPPENTSEEMPTKSKAKRKGKSKKKQLEDNSVDESWEYSLRDALYTACKTGDIDALRRLLLQLPAEENEGAELGGGARLQQQPSSPVAGLVNKALDPSGFTLLHVSSAAGQKAAVQLLMDAGADPACRDNEGRTPYLVAPEKDTRNVFRKYMAEHPDKYDYSRAQIPGPLTEEIELKQTEKKKAQKAAKKQREKEQKEERRRVEQEVEEKRRFASLTDREKRALAAEKRFAQQAATTGTNLSNIKRCWQCGESLLGKIPFQYLDFSFCAPRCVQAHRKAAAAATTTQTAKSTT